MIPIYGCSIGPIWLCQNWSRTTAITYRRLLGDLRRFAENRREALAAGMMLVWQLPPQLSLLLYRAPIPGPPGNPANTVLGFL